MTLNVLGGGLEFTANVDSKPFENSVNRIEQQLKGLTATATKEAGAIDNLIRKIATAVAGYASLAVCSLISSIPKPNLIKNTSEEIREFWRIVCLICQDGN